MRGPGVCFYLSRVFILPKKEADQLMTTQVVKGSILFLVHRDHFPTRISTFDT